MGVGDSKSPRSPAVSNDCPPQLASTSLRGAPEEARVEADVILTRRSPTSPGQASRMSAALQTACAWAADDRDARRDGPPVLTPYASARLHTSIVLTRPGTGAIVEPTWRAVCVRWKLVTSAQPSSTWCLRRSSRDASASSSWGSQSITW